VIEDPSLQDTAVDKLAWILPGFIDLHVHGGAGRDVMDGGDAVSAIATLHARHGTTSMLATTMTAPIEQIKAAMVAIAQAMREQSEISERTSNNISIGLSSQACDPPSRIEASILGVHLEGPYLSAQKRGAQPAHTKPANLAEILALHQIAPLRVITLAPEDEANLRLVLELRDQGFCVQLGHSNASYEQACEAFRCGARSVTHLFNAMSGLHHRAPGLVGAALAHASYAEVIPDLLHVHPGAIRAAYRAIPSLYAVTDATAAAGMPDGEYPLGGQRVFRCLGAVRLADGTLAGSALTMDEAFRNLVSIGLTVEEASAMLSSRPAAMLDLKDRGSIVPGNRADLVVFDAECLQLRQVVVAGQSRQTAW
jgi:N-acetylglucosamine-6-phosphate deacetylase